MTTDPHSPLPSVTAPRLWQRYDAWRARSLDRFSAKHGHRLPSWHNRRGARRSVAVLVASLGLVMLGAILSFFTLWWAAPFAVGIVGGITMQYVLRIVSGSVADTPASALDEIQLAQRNAARSLGFGILIALMFVPYAILIILSITFDDGVPADYVYGSAITLVALLLTGAMIPTILTAWWTADPDESDYS